MFVNTFYIFTKNKKNKKQQFINNYFSLKTKCSAILYSIFSHEALILLIKWLKIEKQG
jgi:hypothetical protein